MSEVRYLTREDILAYHSADFLRRGLTPAPVISEEKLSAAIERPKLTAFGDDAYPTLAQKAAAILQSLVIGHPFLDGNKRVGLGACLLFLELNGIDRRADQRALVDLVLGIARGNLREVDEIAGRLRGLFGIDVE